MQLRLLLASHAATAAMRSGRFPADDALDERGVGATQAWSARIQALRSTAAFRSQAICVEDTARILGLDAQVVPALNDANYGRWHGQRLSDIAASEPESLADWLGEPDAAPHGGESFAAVAERVGAWLDSMAGTSGTVIALTHAPVIRAAIIHALGAPTAYSRIDIAPLSLVELRHSPRGWTWTASLLDS